MRTLLATASLAVPALLNVLLVMLVLLFSFAVLARHLFGAIREGLEAIEPEHRNFADVGRALLVLFESATGETWCGMMHDLRRADCAAVGTRGCTPWAAVPFYMAFVLVAAFVLINVVVAIVIETHSDVQNEQQDEQAVSVLHLVAFKNAWSELDPDADGLIPVSSLRALVELTPHPLGLRDSPHRLHMYERADALRFIAQLKMTVWTRGRDSVIAYHEALDACVARCMPGISAEEMRQQFVTTASQLARFEHLQANTREQALGRLAVLHNAADVGPYHEWPVAQAYATIVLQRRARLALRVIRARREEEGGIVASVQRTFRWMAPCSALGKAKPKATGWRMAAERQPSLRLF